MLKFGKLSSTSITSKKKLWRVTASQGVSEEHRAQQGGIYMTDAQLRFHQLMEDTRYHKAQEANWDAQLRETQRSHMASESLSRYATDTQRWSTEVQANTSRYNAELNAQTQRYATDVGSATAVQTATINANASRYATNVKAETEAARLAFDKATQAFKNSIESKYYTLEQTKAHASVEQTRASTLKALQDVQASMRSLELEAERLGLDRVAQEYRNALTKAQEFETITKGAKNIVSVAQQVIDFFKENRKLEVVYPD